MNDRTYRALLIANSAYEADPNNLPSLEGPRTDLSVLRDALTDPDVGLFSPDNVRLLPERAQTDIYAEVEDLLVTASAADTVLIYYSGHGRLDQSNELYLCARNTVADRLRSTAVPAKWIAETIDQSAAGTTVIVLDCCHSGRFKGGDQAAHLAGEGRFVLTSTRAAELALDTDSRNHASVFTAALVQGLRDATDRDADGLVTLDDVYEFVHSTLRSSGKPIPQKNFAGTGDVPLAVRPGHPADHEGGSARPSSAPPELDVLPSEIDLGEVDLGEELPPERINVINRGGGTLDWSIEVSNSWIDAEVVDNGAILRLTPGPTSARANIYVTDRVSGLTKTVRVRVRVRPGLEPATVAVPRDPDPEQPEPRSTGAQSTAGPSSPMPSRVRVFVSYHRADSLRAAELAQAIETMGATASLDSSLVGGRPWWDSLLDMIEECDVFLPLLSNNYVESEPCRLEAKFAAALGKRFLPVSLAADVRKASLIPQILDTEWISYDASLPAPLSRLASALQEVPRSPSGAGSAVPRPPPPISFLTDGSLADQLDLLPHLRAVRSVDHSSESPASET